MTSESLLSDRIAERLKTWCPNSPLPRYTRDAWREIFESEDALAAKQIAAEAKSLGLDSLRRENADLRQRIATLERGQMVTDRNFKALRGALGLDRPPEGDEPGDYIAITLKAVGMLIDRVKALEARPLDAVDLDFEFDGERTLRVKSGNAVKAFTLPNMIYRGVFKDGHAYSQSDVVSLGGSLWVAKEATTTRPGNANPLWQLACKHGRDGRDAGK